jgi:hypothetical protein
MTAVERLEGALVPTRRGGQQRGVVALGHTMHPRSFARGGIV